MTRASCSRRAALVLIAHGLVAVASGTGCGSRPVPGSQHHVAIAAAADLRFALDEIALTLQRESPGLEITTTYGSSGTLYAQLVNHAPQDMFLSADREYPRRLAEQGLTLPGTEFSYGVGRLVLWIPTTVTGDPGMALLTSPAITHIAIANPEHAPYGVAAVAALRAANVYDAVHAKLVYGENVAQALQFVRSGAAQAAIVARSLVRVPAVEQEGRSWDIPLDWYPRLEQEGVILRWAADPDAARSVRAFLMSDRGRAILQRYGFAAVGA